MGEKRPQDKNFLGFISDTHDNINLIDKAVTRINEVGVNFVLHAGDYVSPFTIPHFKPLNAKMIGVYGNNCAERRRLQNLFKEIGGELRGFFAEVKIHGLKIALLHGHEEELLSSIVTSKAYDLVVYGHTHKVKVQKINGTLVVNPGEVCGYLSGMSTIAILNLETYKVHIIDLSESWMG